jgi:hypothetical protein
LEHERDWQGFSLVTQYLQAGSQARAIELLRELLDRDTRDAELDARCAVAAAWAIRVGHAEVERDRALCAAWIERASAGAPDFAAQIDPRRAPWDRLANGESARPR